MGQIRFMHEMRNIKPEEVYNDNDPNFPNSVHEDLRG
jgi:hypothetical protein